MQYCYVDGDRWLMPDAGNLAAVLYRLQSQDETAYRRIVATVKQVAPFFDDFVLEPTGPGDHTELATSKIRSYFRSTSAFGWDASGHLPD